MRKLLLPLLLLIASATPSRAQQQLPINSGSVLADVSHNTTFKVFLDQNVTNISLTAPAIAPGLNVTFIFQQNATGGFTVTFGGNVSGACTVTSTANSTSLCSFVYDASTNSWFATGGGGGGGGGGNVSNSGTPTTGQYSEWVDATHVKGVNYPTLCSGGQFSQGLSSGNNNCATPTGSGTVNSGTQFALGEYATAGTAIGSGPAPPSTNGIYSLIYNVNAGAAVAPSVAQMVASGRSITGATTTDTVASTDFGTIVTHDKAATGAVTITLPTATTLNNPAFWYKYCNHSPQADTLSPTTWTIQTGSAAAGSSQTIASGVCLTVSPDKNNATQWHGDLTNAGSSGSTAWSALTNAAASLSLTNTGFNSTFTQGASDLWTWQNTASTSSGTVAQNSPSHKLCGEYYNGTADAADCWAFQDQVGTGTNGQSLLVLTHSGSGNSFNGIKFGASESSQITNTGNFNLSINTGGSGNLKLGTGNNSAAVNVVNGLSLSSSTVTFSATPTFNTGEFSIFYLTLTGNVTSSSMSNALTGMIETFIICQDATGGRTFVWPATFRGAPTVTSTASKCTTQAFVTPDGTNWFASPGTAE